MNIIPLPRSVTELPGTFTLTNAATIAWRTPTADSNAAQDVANLLAEYLRPATGYTFPVAPASCDAPAAITLTQTDSPAPDANGFYPENYTLSVDPTKGIHIEAPAAAGLARAIQTLRQLLPTDIYNPSLVTNTAWTLPAVQIDDAPTYAWRGLHLDVSRHFFSADDVCRYIELLAQHRMSVFHWHLTDDQGWRIEIKKYPRLTKIGSVRSQTLIGHMGKAPRKYDGTPYGGFYTQDDIRRVVAFAARRHITVVPEIDMPGHMGAAIAAYPELGNGMRSTPHVRNLWGIADEVLNMEDATVQFCKDVWTELFDLFPSLFYHIGGDEAPRREWVEDPRTQELMAQRNLSGEDELQAWFTTQIEDFFNAHGRRLIGWDEIAAGGIKPSAAIMHWRQWFDPIPSIRRGNPFVLAIGSHLYFDHYQHEPQAEEPLAIGGLSTLGHVYNFDLSSYIKDDTTTQFLGAQGQLWTEYIATRDYLDYMAYPRATALAEVLWTPKDQRSFASFSQRLVAQRARFDAFGVKACPHS